MSKSQEKELISLSELYGVRTLMGISVKDLIEETEYCLNTEDGKFESEEGIENFPSKTNKMLINDESIFVYKKFKNSSKFGRIKTKKLGCIKDHFITPKRFYKLDKNSSCSFVKRAYGLDGAGISPKQCLECFLKCLKSGVKIKSKN